MKQIIFLISVLCGFSAYSAEVTKKLKKSKKIVISEGKNNGFTKDSEACVYDDEDTEVYCGTIQKAKKTKSLMKVKKRKVFKKIKKGMTVKLKNADGAVTQTADASGATSTEPKGATNFKLGYILTPLTPSVYNVISYLDPDGNTVNTLWDADRVSSLSLLGFGAEFGFGIFGSKAAVGVRMREYKGFTIKANYTGDRSLYAETTLNASATGFYFDFNYLILDYGSMSLDFGNGLDIDSAALTMTTDQKSDSSEESVRIYEASSTATTISLRTNININFYFDPIGVQAGTSLLIPLTASVSDSITATDSQIDTNLGGGVTAEDDVRQAIGHDKGSIGLEMFFSAYFAF
ncbi:hypothetical protein [Pseudobacteriovorax antillogorgiicola]|uniref:Uncharacterized protein n=1 Tax=Pseudobacteriovorax antillogorgiicola TaxID=1513793 RepID=A0A1Y6B979_9BACT|nr:hypothetical protein [Pseudobacteriovorax antillogorgiicola]TCS59137.1 hypothetical protein EDD56_10140 [Pseudobacteriovorax antillogorgiicola]SME91295.1 hypothetical protein SAMN06296036_101446 [Pseudobacteriovorax antillogorgiicola]